MFFNATLKVDFHITVSDIEDSHTSVNNNTSSSLEDGCGGLQTSESKLQKLHHRKNYKSDVSAIQIISSQLQAKLQANT